MEKQTVLEKGQWTPERAWEWYNSRPWIRGFNGYPSNCVNRIAMWQKHNHEAVFQQIEKEFQLAKETGFNAVRAIIQFECWYYEHDSFMAHLEEYLTLAAKYGLGVMLTLGNDCTIPKCDWKPVVFGEQPIDWGYHSGICRGPHAKGHVDPGYCLLDDPAFEPEYYKMVDELAAKYAKDERLEIWDVWNEPGNGRRGSMSLRAMERFFEIIRSYDPIQPLTADAYSYTADFEPKQEIQRRAIELSDIVTFHYYRSYENMILLIEKLRETGRPLINNEWLNRIEKNDVSEMFPLFYLEGIGSYHWGLIAGYSQTYEPWGKYFDEEQLRAMREAGINPDMSKWQHDLYRFNGYPYDEAEIATIKRFSRLADERFQKKGARA
jgi:hypothetical protein